MTLTRERSKDDFKDMAADIMEECDALINMINTMLEITEAETGVGEQKFDEFDLTELVLDACEIFRPMAEDKQIAIKMSSPDNIYFRGDRRKAQRIVTNLLENAIKYTPDRGTVTVSVRKDNGRVDLIVEDTGIGISQEELPRIFERFYRGEKSRSDSGIGLGLSLAKAFAVSLGGAITAQSTLGKGSTFAVSFPN